MLKLTSFIFASIIVIFSLKTIVSLVIIPSTKNISGGRSDLFIHLMEMKNNGYEINQEDLINDRKSIITVTSTGLWPLSIQYEIQFKSRSSSADISNDTILSVNKSFLIKL